MQKIEKDFNKITEENIELEKKVTDLNRGMRDLMDKLEKSNNDKLKLTERLSRARDLIDHLTAVYV